jgi:hypothetical protein
MVSGGEWMKADRDGREAPVVCDVRWRVSAGRLPSTIRPEGGGGERTLTLVLRIEGEDRGAWSARAWAESASGARGETAIEASGSGARALRVEARAAGDVTLIEAPDLLSATLDRGEDGSWRVLYVRTTLLERLELLGGCYEVAGGRVEMSGRLPTGREATRRNGRSARAGAHGSASGGRPG